MNTPKPVVLCILDGWGLSDVKDGNAPFLAKTPTVDRIMRDCPNATLITHGPDVGLPRGQMGNSEVGHTNIGAGRVVAMDLGQIDLAIEEGTFEQNQRLVDFITAMKASGGTAHLMGLVSDGGVHGHLTHMIAAAKALDDAGVPVVIHALTDGRDVAPRSAKGFFKTLEAALPRAVKIVTVTGRYYAMDRDNRWERVEKAFEAIARGQGLAADDAQSAVDAAYARDENDEFVQATVIGGYQGVQDGDGFFCLNFRADRAREIMAALGDPAFDGFDAGQRPDWAGLMGMAAYSDQHTTYMTTVYPKPEIINTLGAWVASHDLRQFRLAETEKYPHVTFFLNGGEETPSTGEDRFMPKSPDVATYDLMPQMSSAEVTDRFVGAIEDGYDLIVVNYANPDMVGHTGDLDAAIAACEAVDAGLARVCAALEKAGGAMVLTADHGNCEMMIDPETGGAHTAHTLNRVPVALIGGTDGAQLAEGRLADLAPTLLHLMGLEQPEEMTGACLIS
ncbi:2,3-bisphosphoglycerate-independent phosphoglycerate mutase [Sulfitobacter mediterraneus]|uniref:2,3-bisphosphoglycerate-independent phosphoglycerate mutase n=1 Tax=Sulfitobacter mediterraneus TaxID=83219 RepID=UPI00193433AD|nr:2,3-bisphosphoglycerate-independent phosphoglycerate mutase [Sulfitobacter mediterraneus]MBM1308851.1 2,3-bisphosphoglycerate-independent phosphoglycerate mutase [Sulfitobacter mediterraneus]MBM1312736.1 2,3-bisphosphoglycerate-independent phosphoglycerate mutase [Sulfitobacter mediterraneus]MBM1321118.1 2,3-bisphosphoglycerate-independent phosphoglycerate mutase [Sulfitobacter mediterraneus]MBM1325005.1 2,3-bisphosphoglycerate-independent phosphoglycerate mutase [Sulfitobacter mediterraneus